MFRKKLIETMLPVSAINREAEREKNARGGLPGNIHPWWSRRPMAAARSVIFASCVDDPAAHPELFPTEKEQKQERQRLLELTEALCRVESASDEALLSEAKKEIIRYAEGQLPAVFDPFAGSGAIPVEAQRLGLKTKASDLNPVAVMITKLAADVPARFANRAPVHPRTEMELSVPEAGMRGFAEDVRYYGEWMLSEARKELEYLYPQVTDPASGEELDVAAWIWARTVKCPNPSCGCELPLSSGYDLAKRKGSEAWVEPCVENGTVQFRIHRSANNSQKGKPKVAQTAVFRCPVCGEITPDAYVKECGVNHKIHSRLIAIVADNEDGRQFLPASPEQETAASTPRPAKVPHGTLPDFPRRFAPPSFGLTDYADLFTDRQLCFLTEMMKLAREAQNAVEKAAIANGLPDDGISFAAGGSGALAYAEAVRLALTLTVSKLLDRCSNLCSWDSSGGGSLRNVFSRAAMPMIWDYAEANPFAASSGSFLLMLLRTCESIASLPSGMPSETTVQDAALPNHVRGAMLSTELPYYDRASYADLSDFFYVWLRYGLADIFPDYFQTEITPKKEELTAFPYRWNGDRQQANAFYAEGLRLAMKNLYESTAEDYPSTVSFFYKGYDAKADSSLSEWEAFIASVYDAGFTITASWSLGRKYEDTVELAESRGIPITVVLRKREADAPQTTRRTFVTAVKRELPALVETLKKDVSLMDLRPSVIGQALNIFTRYGKVLDADGTAMRSHMASRIIEQELDMILASVYGSNENKCGGEEETRDGRES